MPPATLIVIAEPSHREIDRLVLRGSSQNAIRAARCHLAAEVLRKLVEGEFDQVEWDAEAYRFRIQVQK